MFDSFSAPIYLTYSGEEIPEVFLWISYPEEHYKKKMGTRVFFVVFLPAIDRVHLQVESIIVSRRNLKVMDTASNLPNGIPMKPLKAVPFLDVKTGGSRSCFRPMDAKPRIQYLRFFEC